MALYKLDWLYNVLGEMQEHPRATLTSVHNQIKNEIRTLQRDDDRAGELEEYLSVMFYAYVETLDEQDRWRNNPDDINGTCSVAYAQREGFLKYLISAAADIKRACHVEVSRAFIEQWRGFISKRGNRLPDEQLVKIAPLTAANKTNEAAQIPAELSSEDAQAILKRAVDAGLCEQVQGSRYNWLKSAELLGYFIYKMFGKGLSFRKGENISWIGWQNFFGTDDNMIKAARQKVNNFNSHMGKYPDGYLLVDNVVNK